MVKNSVNKNPDKTIKKRHRFFLNFYSDCAFTKCPKCDSKTKLRKFPLVIHIEPKQLFLLNKQCKYCPNCDLIIAKKQEIEPLMAATFVQTNPQIVGNNYVVMGTVDKKDWKEGDKSLLSPSEMVGRIYVFKDVWNFEVIPAGWYPNEEK
ncbi:hypothetical protein H6G97_51670 [Nostoc flagelliforme FACHB-838]|uniref:Uncharacterized protein n=1 Tax=Nostoc flagelliforme FACHB-838 TaxID=2692904 RepID=A0ABR8E7Z6_9NOSO|nr:hypothetical protein [Nostoc flagelliforme FACHB-838]